MTTIRDMAAGRSGSDPSLRGIFAPREKPMGFGELMSTFKGFGKNGAGREGFLNALERFNVVTPEQRAAGGGATSVAAGAAGVASSETGAMAAGDGAIGGAATVVDNPVYGGLWAAHMRSRGFAMPMYGEPGAVVEPAAAAAAPEVAEDAAKAGAAVADEAPIEAAADDAAKAVAGVEKRFIDSLQRLQQVPAEQHLPTLATAVDATAAAGNGDDALAVLTRELASRPLEGSVSALDEAIEAAAKVAPEAATAAKAAPEAAQAAKVASEVLPEAPQVVRTLSKGVSGAMGFEAAIADTLRLLAKV